MRASNYFYCFNGITVNLTEERDRGNMSHGLNLVDAATPVLAPTMLECPIRP